MDELGGHGEVVKVERRPGCNPLDVGGYEAAITVDMHKSGCLTLFCSVPEVAEFRLGQRVRLTLTAESAVTTPSTPPAGKKPKRSATESSST